MLETCVLKTEGYSILLEFLQLRPSAQDMLIRSTLILDPLLGDVSYTSTQSWILASDVESLVSYFEEHMRLLKEDNNHVSHTFVDLDLHFQIQAFVGDISADNIGEFSLQFMLNVGRSGEGHTYTYLGCESVVAVQDVTAFIDSIRAVLAKYQDFQSEG
jgi:hypothetical protein